MKLIIFVLMSSYFRTNDSDTDLSKQAAPCCNAQTSAHTRAEKSLQCFCLMFYLINNTLTASIIFNGFHK